MTRETSVKLGALLKRMRNDRCITQAQLAAALGVESGAVFISAIESGKSKVPLAHIRRIMSVMKMDAPERSRIRRLLVRGAAHEIHQALGLKVR